MLTRILLKDKKANASLCFIKLRKVCLKNCYTTQAILFCNLCHNLRGLDKIYSHFAYQGKAKEYLKFHSSGFCDLRFVKNRCHTTRGAAKLKNLNMSQSVYTFPKISRKKNSTKLIFRLAAFSSFPDNPLKKKRFLIPRESELFCFQ